MTKRIAEALVECGYADYQGMQKIYSKGTEYLAVYWVDPEIDDTCEPVEPFADTLEGRRQLEELFDHLFVKWRKDNNIHELTQIFLQDIEKGIREAKIKFIREYFEQLEAQSDA